MLGTTASGRLVPMAHYPDKEGGSLWFVTHAGTELAAESKLGPQEAIFIGSSEKQGLYTHIRGMLQVEHDPAKLDEIWNAVVASWFDHGERDPDITLMQFKMAAAEVWASVGGAKFLYEIAKAQVSGQKPDVGDNYTLSF